MTIIQSKFGNIRIMNRSGTQSSFFIRTVNHSRHTTCELPKQPLTIEPSRVQISNYAFDKISVAQLTLRNDSKLPRKFKIVQPSKSYFSVKYADKEIPGKETIDIYVCFNPQKEKAVIEDQLIIKVEGDPTTIHVPIICYPKHFLGKSSNKGAASNRENQEGSEKIVRRPSIRLKKMASKSSLVLQPAEYSMICIQKSPQYSTVIEFEERFRKISEYVRQKCVKNEVYLGVHLLCKEKEQEIKRYSIEITAAERERLYFEIKNRFITQYRTDGPIATTLLDCNITWNQQRNTPSLTFALAMNKIQEEVKKYVTSLRFEKIQNSLKLYQEYKKKEEKQGRKLKLQDYVQYHSCRSSQAKVSLDYQLEFDRSSLKPTALPVEPSFKTFQGKFQVTEMVDFDNWVPMNILRPGSWETYLEKQVQIPDFCLHHPVLTNDYRKGSPQEAYYKDPSSILTEQMPTLTSLLETSLTQQEHLSHFQLDGLKPELKAYYSLDEVEEPDLIPEQEILSLGPLNSARWRKKTNTSIDIFGLLKNNDN